MRTLQKLIIALTSCIFIVKAATVEELFATHQVVPDVVSVAPTDLATVEYSNSIEVELGAELTPSQVKDVPTVSWNATSDQFYTLMMIDPDAPSRQDPEYRSWQHWLVTNIPADNQSAGNTLSAYVGAGPGQDSGLHRYVVLIYQQPGLLEFEEPLLNNTSALGRPGFNVTAFANKYNLSQPVAGNFFQTQYDEYVDELYVQLGITSGAQTLKFGLTMTFISLCFGAYV